MQKKCSEMQDSPGHSLQLSGESGGSSIYANLLPVPIKQTRGFICDIDIISMSIVYIGVILSFENISLFLGGILCWMYYNSKMLGAWSANQIVFVLTPHEMYHI